MIKVTDLRIGNLIIPKLGTEEEVTVTDIDEGGIIGTTAFFWDGKGTTGTVSESAQGILLTPELLRKYGFKENGSGHWEGPKIEYDNVVEWFCLKQYDNGSFGLMGSEWPLGKPFRFLHQLQNLFFCHAEEELTIKETV